MGLLAMGESTEKYLGAYRGTPIRCKYPEQLISLTDLHKASGSPSSLRPDKWLKLPEVQEQLLVITSEGKVQCQIDSKGNIVGISSVLEVFRGGDRFFQGTFASLELVTVYAKSLSSECYQWLQEVTESTGQTNQTVKAKREVILLGNLQLNVFQLPNGTYLLSQTQTADSIAEDEISVRRFLKSDSPEALPYKGFTPDKLAVEGTKTRINGIPIPLAVAYWTKEAASGNSVAARLLGACAIESIERRADKAFGVSRTEDHYNERFAKAFESFVTQLPEAKYLSKNSLKEHSHEIKLSSPFQSFYSEVSRKLKKTYETGGIPGLSKEDIKDKIALLSTYVTNSWRLTPCQELTYKLGSLIKTKYPDLVSETFAFDNQGHKEKARFIIQIFDLIVDYQDIEECVLKRRYVQIAKETFGIDHAFIFFVSPFGATPDAVNFVEAALPDEIKGRIGILTVKELYNFYYNQAIQTRQGNKIKPELNRKFKDFSAYKVPNSKFDFFTDSVEPIQLSLFEDNIQSA